VAFAELDREFSLLLTLDWNARSERVGDLARAVILDNPAAALALAATKLTPNEAAGFRSQLVARWATKDITAAVEWSRRQTGSNREELLSTIVQSWARRDAPAALAFVAQMPELDLRAALRRAAFTGLADTDPDAAWARVAGIAAANERRELTQIVLVALARKDGEKAANRALTTIESTGVDDFQLQLVLGVWLEYDSAAATTWLAKLPAGPRRLRLIPGLVGDLARQNPEAALGLAGSLPPGSAREQAFQAVLATWSRQAPEAATRWAAAQSDPSLGRVARLAVIDQLSISDPRRAATLLADAPNLSLAERDGHLSQIARQWALRDPAEALAWANALPLRLQLSTVPGILAQHAEADPLGAAAQAVALTEPRLRQQALQMIVGEWGGRDSAAAADWLVHHADRRLTGELAPGLIQQLAETDLNKAEALAKELPPGESRNRALSGIVAGLANSNLEQAQEFLAKLPPGAAKDGALEQLAWVWGRQDPAAAARFALDQPDTDGRSRLLDAAATEWAQRDPAAAADFYHQLGAGQGREAFADNLARHWAEADPKAALGWIQSLPATDQRPELLANLMSTWAQQSPGEAATAAGLLPPESQEAAVRSVIQAYASQDPATGAKWLASFPEGELRGAAQSAFVSQWAQEDAAAVGTWLRDQPEGPARQSAIEEFTRSMTQREPASAWEWAGAVADPASRINLQQQAIERWMRVDPAAARQALEDSSLPEATKLEFRGRR